MIIVLFRKIIFHSCFIKIIFFSSIIFSIDLFAQQININRIEMMPNLPSPYEMRDWKQVAKGYDSLVFDQNLTGDFLPLIWTDNNSVNYPGESRFGLHTVVGTTSPNSAEAINCLPAVISASLVGIDKSDQNGNDWVKMCAEWFNKNNGLGVYKNHPDDLTYDDFWYETMPNVFFYQLYALYPNTNIFQTQFTSVADKWLEAVKKMGGSNTPWSIPNINHRGFDLKNMEPFDGSVHEPEAAGAIAWILYNAYKETNNEKYRIGAELCIEYLNSLNTNPSYELQLPYGVYTAARMNAELGTNYNIEKMINWCFNIGPLRNWGAVVGNWGGYDISGLIGEIISNDYAFAMNGFEQAGALVPLVRYDERYARAIGKWVLNLANASRLFYPKFLPDNHQDSEQWAHQYDPNSYIAHEAIREEVGAISPYATGDAIDGNWGETNLALYGSSHAGILGSIIDTTNIEMILKLDVLKTDYFHVQSFSTYLYYNPYNENKIVEINVGSGQYDIYDAVSNSFLMSGVTGKVSFSINSDSAVLIVLVPSGGNVTFDLNNTLVNGIIVDYNSGQTISNYPPRIKSLSAKSSLLVFNDSTNIYCSAFDKDNDELSYEWFSNYGTVKGNGETINWIAPDTSGNYKIFCKVDDGNGNFILDSVIINVAEFINSIPIIQKINANPRKLYPGEISEINCFAYDPDNDSLFFSWNASSGILNGSGNKIFWTAPGVEGNFKIFCSVADIKGGIKKDSIEVEVRDSSNQTGNLIAFYPFNGNSIDESGNNNNGNVFQAKLTNDRFGNFNSAYSFDGINDRIEIPNDSTLNFQNGITLNFWIKTNSFYDREQYPLSHGNWENRWKVSITNKKIRWTVKTNTGVKDLDTETEIKLDSIYNVSVSYNGSDLEIYLNGNLDAFTNFTGKILTTNINLMIGQVLPGNSNYNFNGTLDDLRIYDYSLPREEINNLYNITTSVEMNNDVIPAKTSLYQNYPNPFNPSTEIIFDLNKASNINLDIFNIIGEKIQTLSSGFFSAGRHSLIWNADNYSSGIYFFVLKTGEKIFTKKMILLK